MGLWFRKDISRAEHEIDEGLRSRFGSVTLESFHYIEVFVDEYGGAPESKVVEYLHSQGYLRVDAPSEPATSSK